MDSRYSDLSMIDLDTQTRPETCPSYAAFATHVCLRQLSSKNGYLTHTHTDDPRTQESDGLNQGYRRGCQGISSRRFRENPSARTCLKRSCSEKRKGIKPPSILGIIPLPSFVRLEAMQLGS
jgi:hypothetical protein